VDGPEVHAWTSDRYMPDADVRRDWQRIPVPELADVLKDRALLLNPDTELEVRLPAAALSTPSHRPHQTISNAF
jgi:hypothetical protein